MEFIDTHAHLYLPEFDKDRNLVVATARQLGVQKIILPNIDHTSILPLNKLTDCFPGVCFPLMGLHPTSVKEDFQDELITVREELASGRYYGVGEIGIDLYWDKQYLCEQRLAFEDQIRLALQYDLPVVIHARESFTEIFDTLEKFGNSGLTGIFHAFTGDADTAAKVIAMGFKLGIGGILTFKNSGLRDVLTSVSPEHIVLETDSPYLSPVPMRGKRNESSYLLYTAEILAKIKNMTLGQVADMTSANALAVFKKIADHD
jgi:TatD DNase family protein